MKKTAFKNIKTKLDLITRIVRDENGNNILSTGNQLKAVLRFLDQAPLIQSGVQNIEVQVSFANRITGVDYATLYINIHDNLYNETATMEQADLIRQLRSNEDNYIPEELKSFDLNEPVVLEEIPSKLKFNKEDLCIIDKDVNKVYIIPNEKLISDEEQEYFNNKLAKLLVSAFEEIENPDIKHTTFDENTTDEELCDVLGIDVEEFKERNKEVFEELKNPSDRIIDLIHDTSPRIKISPEYKGRSIGVNSTIDSDESAGVLISSDSFINELKSREINNDAVTFIPEGYKNYQDFINNIDSSNKVQTKRKTEKELIKELEDEFIDNLADECLDLTRLLHEEVINFDQYSDTILKAVRKYIDTKESPEFKKELMRARMYDKFFSHCENLR